MSDDRLEGVSLLVFAGPREKFSEDEFGSIASYIRRGGSVLFLLPEGGEDKLDTNANFLLEQFGISVNADAVVRAVYHKYLHPKEALINSGVIDPGFTAAASALVHKGTTDVRCGLFLERRGAGRV